MGHMETAGLLSQPPQDSHEPENPDGDFAFKAVLVDDGVLDFVNHFFPSVLSGLYYSINSPGCQGVFQIYLRKISMLLA